nr:Sir2 family NAD-dependent protein deacetylase [uncultured Cohaesibacter sp.]
MQDACKNQLPEQQVSDHESKQLQGLIDEAKSIVAFTGAGISTESGIPDFRSPNGIWSKMEPIQFGDFVRSEQARLEDWRRRFVMNEEFRIAEPNEGHKALVRLAEVGKLSCAITQNIDGLHQKSGLSDDLVIEIHGNSTYGSCLDCNQTMSLETAKAHIDNHAKAPCCPSCGGLVKAAVISFGQAMPEDKMQDALTHIQKCDLLIVMGSSLVVYPAARLPEIAKHYGAKLVIINRDPTPLDDLADLCVHGEIGPVMQSIR